MAIWRIEDIGFTFLDDLVDHPVVTIAIDTPVGELRAMAVPEAVGRIMFLRRAHVHAEHVGINEVGAANFGARRHGKVGSRWTRH